MKHPIAVIQTSKGSITVELFPEQAPNTVRAFVWLAQQGLFDNRRIRRIAPGFVLQPSYSDFDDPRCAVLLNGEYEANGIPNAVPFRKGTVAMGGEGNTASGSCFFFTLTDEAGQRLAGKYAAFGLVTEGWETVERIAAVPTRPVKIADTPNVVVNEPIEPEYLLSVTVETFGEKYPKPEILEEI